MEKNVARKKTRINWFQQLLAPPVFEGEEDKTRLAQILNIFMLIGICCTIIGIAIAGIIVSPFWIRAIPLVLLLLSQFVVYGLSRKGQIRLASFLLVGGGWTGVTISIAISGGVRAPSFVVYIVIILCAGIFLSRFWLYFFSALSIGAGLVMLLADGLGLLPVVQANPVLTWVVQGIMLVISGALLRLSTYNIEEALKQARHEIVQRQKVEQKLQESEARSRLALDAARMGVWNWNIPADRLSWSEQVTSLFNLPLESSSATVQAFLEFLSPENRSVIEKAVEEALTNKETSYEVVLQHKEGVERRWFEAKGQVFRDSSGQPVQMTGIVTDITERRQAELALRFSREQFYKVFHTTPVCMSLLDGSEYRYLEINEAFTRITGYSYSEVIGHTALELQLWVEPKDRVQVMERFEAGNSIRDFEMQFRRKSGETGIALLSLDALELNGKTSLLVAMLDITERKQAEEAMKFRLKFEKLLSSISNRFANLSVEEIDNTIIETLKIMGEFIGVERGWGTQFIKDQGYFRITHEWIAEGITPSKDELNRERKLKLPFIHPKLLSKELIDISSVDQLPPEATVEKAFWQATGAKSVVIVPQVWAGEVVGAWGFHSIQTEKKWSTDIFSLLQFVGEILTNALVRKQTEEALRTSEKKFRSLIQDLNVGVILQGPQAEILLANTAALTLLGLTEDQLLGKTSFDPDWNVIHEDGSPFPGTDHPVPQAIATGQPVSDVIMGVYRPSRQDTVWLLVNALPELDIEGKVRHVTCTFNDITHRKLAEEQLRRQTRRVEALAELSQLLAEVSQDYPKVLDTIVRQITELVGDVCSIFLISADGQWFDLVAAYSPDLEVVNYFRELIAASPQRITEGLAGQVFRTGQPILLSSMEPEKVVPTVKSEHQEFALRFPIYSRAMIPLKAQGQIIGGLSLSRFTPERPYTLEDQAFLQDLADRAALAITNARLYSSLEQELTERRRIEEQLRQQAIRAQALAELSQLLANVSLDYNQVLNTVARRISEVMGDVCIIRLISEDEQYFELAAVYHSDPEVIKAIWSVLEKTPQKTNEGLLGQVYQTGQPILVATSSNPNEVRDSFKPEYQVLLDQFPVHSRLAIPLKVQGRTIGVMAINRYTAEKTYTLEDQAFLQDLADRAALSITNARLYSTLQQELTERRQIEEQLRQQKGRIQSLAELSQALAEVSQDYPKVLNTVVRHIAEVIGDGCAITLVSTNGQELELAAIYHPDPEPVEVYRKMTQKAPVNINEGVVAKVFQTGQPLLQPSLSKAEVLASIKPEYQKEAEKYLIYSRIIVPLKAQGRIIGVLTLSRYRPNSPYTLEDMIFLQDLADRAALAISNARLYSALEQELTERRRAEVERETLISELEVKNAELERFTYTVSHDLKSPLITIRGFLGYLEKDALAGNIDRLQTDVRRIADATTKMQRLLDELLELSRIGRLTNPPEKLAFEAIAREALALVEGRIMARQVKIEMEENFPPLYGDRVRLVEVIQNLVDNAVKFMGDQPEPIIRLGWRMGEDGNPVFFVSDNGIGIDPRYHEKVFNLFDKLDPRSEGTGVGLALVKRIIEVHGGRIWVESIGSGNGTTFCFKLPEKISTAEGKE